MAKPARLVRTIMALLSEQQRPQQSPPLDDHQYARSLPQGAPSRLRLSGECESWKNALLVLHGVLNQKLLPREQQHLRGLVAAEFVQRRLSCRSWRIEALSAKCSSVLAECQSWYPF